MLVSFKSNNSRCSSRQWSDFPEICHTTNGSFIHTHSHVVDLCPATFMFHTQLQQFFAAGWTMPHWQWRNRNEHVMPIYFHGLETEKLHRNTTASSLSSVWVFVYLPKSFHEASRWARMVHHLQSVRYFPRTRDNIFVIQILLSPHCATQNLMVLLRIWQS